MVVKKNAGIDIFSSFLGVNWVKIRLRSIHTALPGPSKENYEEDWELGFWTFRARGAASPLLPQRFHSALLRLRDRSLIEAAKVFKL